MRLYYSAGVCSLAVRITIHELGVACDFEAVNLKTKQTERDDDYWFINPKGSVPALKLASKEILTENAVIQQYLADHHPESHMLPKHFERYRCLEWLNFVSTDLHKSCSPLFNAKVSDQDKDEIFKPILKTRLDFVERHLNNHTYLMGNEFTIADSYLFVVLSWLGHFNIALSNWPNLTRYFDQVLTRPAVKKSLQEEKIKLVRL